MEESKHPIRTHYVLDLWEASPWHTKQALIHAGLQLEI